MSENENYSVSTPEVNYVNIEIKKTKIDENGHIYEVTEKRLVPDFLASILAGTGNILIDE